LRGEGIMKKIIQGLLLLLFFTSTVPSFAEEIEIRAIVPKPIGGLPKTGQTIQYDIDNLKPDDGWYQMGNPVTPRFVPGAGAEAGTVTDNATGLMWEQKTNDGGIHDYRNIYHTWTEIFDVFLNGSGGLNTNKFANQDDWRIPNIRELESIVNLTKPSPSIYPIFKEGLYRTQSNFCWSSTTDPLWTPYALVVNFTDGGIYSQPKAWNGDNLQNCNSVRAVRGGVK